MDDNLQFRISLIQKDGADERLRAAANGADPSPTSLFDKLKVRGFAMLPRGVAWIGAWR
jgi:hypothetical protein